MVLYLACIWRPCYGDCVWISSHSVVGVCPYTITQRRCLLMRWAVFIQYTSVTNRQTDGHPDTSPSNT